MAHVRLKNYDDGKIWLVRNGQIVRNPEVEISLWYRMSPDDKYVVYKARLFDNFNQTVQGTGNYTQTVTQTSEGVKIDWTARPQTSSSNSPAGIIIRASFIATDYTPAQLFFEGSARFTGSCTGNINAAQMIIGGSEFFNKTPASTAQTWNGNVVNINAQSYSQYILYHWAYSIGSLVYTNTTTIIKNFWIKR